MLTRHSFGYPFDIIVFAVLMKGLEFLKASGSYCAHK